MGRNVLEGGGSISGAVEDNRSGRSMSEAAEDDGNGGSMSGDAGVQQMTMGVAEACGSFRKTAVRHTTIAFSAGRRAEVMRISALFGQSEGEEGVPAKNNSSVRATAVRRDVEQNVVLAGDPKMFRLLCNTNLNMIYT